MCVAEDSVLFSTPCTPKVNFRRDDGRFRRNKDNVFGKKFLEIGQSRGSSFYRATLYIEVKFLAWAVLMKDKLCGQR